MPAAGRVSVARPFSLEKIIRKESTGQAIYRSERSWNTKCNFQIFTATEFLAAAVEHIPPEGWQGVRYYRLYSNKVRGLDGRAGRRRPEAPLPPPSPPPPPRFQGIMFPPPPVQRARSLRPLWNALIRLTWAADPMVCPCCRGTMKKVGKMIQREKIEFFLRLHGLWEGVIALPPPPDDGDLEADGRVFPV